ncbi:MAG: hypothetical protein ACFFF4_11090 [Candidatus Thorarchaeota archaeon]
MKKRINVRERTPIIEWPEEERRMAIIARMTADRIEFQENTRNGGG